MKVTAYFKEIRKQIIERLNAAKSEIDIAVCWFTNDEIFQLVCEKLEDGLNVRLIILDDYINANPLGCNFSQYIELGGQLHLSDVDMPMHNKYCIIDGRILINGSYNWTYFAESRNEENINIFEDCPDLIEQYNYDFQRLLDKYSKVETFSQNLLIDESLRRFEDKERNAFGVTALLAKDLFQKAIETNKIEYYQAAKKIVPDNINYQKKAIELDWDKEYELKNTYSEKVINNKTAVIFEKGTKLPSTKTITFRTTADNQTSVDFILLRGESEIASKNKILRKYKLHNIPSLPAGEAAIKTEYRLTNNAVLYIKKYIHNTGMTENRKVDLKNP